MLKVYAKYCMFSHTKFVQALGACYMDCSTIHDYDKAAQGIYYFALFSIFPYTLHCYKCSHIFGLSLYLVHLPFALVFSSAGDDVEQKHTIVKKHFIYHKSELCCQPTVIALTGSAAGSLSL